MKTLLKNDFTFLILIWSICILLWAGLLGCDRVHYRVTLMNGEVHERCEIFPSENKDSAEIICEDGLILEYATNFSFEVVK